MNEVSQQARRGPSQRNVEIGVALVTGLLGAVTMIGSWQVGIGWGVEGPRAGFFPFYVGLIIVGCSIVNVVKAAAETPRGDLFADYGQLGSVMSVMIPTAIYVAAIPYTGIYAASIVLIAVFMKWLGRYSIALTLAISIGVPVAIFFMFEKWFLVSLPKGPLEDLLGL